MTQKPAAPTPRTPFAAKLVIGLSCLNLLALCLVSSVEDGFVYVLAPVGSLLPQKEA